MELMRTFYLVATLKSMARASEQLNTTRATVSRQIQNLEQRLGGIKLMERYPSGIQLTDEGEVYFQHVREVIAKEEFTRSLLKEQANAEEGDLKVLAVAAFGTTCFSQFVGDFQQTYPNIRLDIDYGNSRSIELASAHSGVYVGVTTVEPQPGTPLIWSKLASYATYPYAHANYLAKYGMPESFADLDAHKIIGYKFGSEFSYISNRKVNILLYLGRLQENPRVPSLVCNDAMGSRALMENGAGIGLLPKYMVRNTGLVEILKGTYDEKEAGIYNAYIVYPPHLKKYKRVQVLKNFLIEKMAQTGDFF